jgi:hypothetical protein
VGEGRRRAARHAVGLHSLPGVRLVTWTIPAVVNWRLVTIRLARVEPLPGVTRMVTRTIRGVVNWCLGADGKCQPPAMSRSCSMRSCARAYIELDVFGLGAGSGRRGGGGGGDEQ